MFSTERTQTVEAIRLINEGTSQWTTGSVNQAIGSFSTACSILVPHIVPSTVTEPVTSNKTDNIAHLIVDLPTQFRSGVHISTNYFIVAETWSLPTADLDAVSSSQPFTTAVALINLAVSMHIVGLLFECQHQWIKGAETMYKAALERLLVLSGEEPARLAVCALNNLAAIHNQNGDYGDEWKALSDMDTLLSTVQRPIVLFGQGLYQNLRSNILFCAGGPYTAPMA